MAQPGGLATKTGRLLTGAGSLEIRRCFPVEYRGNEAPRDYCCVHRWRPNQAVHTYKHIPHLSGREPDSAGETCQPGVHSTQAERNLHFARKKMGLVQRRLEAATSSVPVQHLQVETGCGAQSPASVLKAPTPSSQANGPPSSSNGGTSACL